MNTIDSESQEQFHVSSVRYFPEEWDNKTLLDAVGMKKDLIVAGPFGSNLKVSDYMDEGIPIIRLQNIDYGKFIDKEIKYISHEKARELAYHSFRAGDLVLAKLGDPIGKTCIVPDYFKDGIVVADVVRVRVADGLADKKFIMYSLNSVATKNQLINGTIGSTRPRVNLDQIRDIQILVPPLNEQRKIAAILSSVDAAIEQTNAIIAQTERVKKGLVQNLLTGKQRLPMFGDNWKMVAFEQVASIRREKVNPKIVGELPFCIELEHIEQSSGRLIGSSKTSEQSSIKSVFCQGDVLFGKLRAYLRKCWLADRDGYCSTEIWPLIPNRRLIAPGFLFQLVMTDRFIDAASITYGTHMPRTDWDVVKGYQINLPSIPEQEAIVAILSSIDKKLDEEKKYRDHLVKLKSGLMQDLLTGRVRAKVDDHA
ncbi:MAG TPA: restriction endonuclease subunit S [Candidatus Cloacimonadota bacterium]|nr:restriction endonuclease subunit S [Candidatus Cloacimonadota bacterium]